MPFKFNLGDELKDNVTGFKGIATIRSEYITGCDGYCLQPPIDKDGKVPDAKVFDDVRLSLVKAAVVKSYTKEEKKAERTGGPQQPLPDKS